jgi:hypothetical protein
LNLAEKTKQSKTTLKSIHQLNHSSSLKGNPIKLEFKVKIGVSTLKLVASASAS